jgi:hypothetical protein
MSEVKITELDYRSDDATIAKQETQINTFLKQKTLNDVSIVDEWVIGFHNSTTPTKQSKVKIFQLVKEISENGVAATETKIENFLSGKKLLSIHPMDGGVIMVVYE